jgi:hypothetical protein
VNGIIDESVHAMAQMILEHSVQNPTKFDWSIQGFGMLRLYLPQDMRLNVWNSRFRIPNVSLIHTHPWNFESYIERGKLTNIRYERVDEEPTHEYAVIKPGPGGGIMERMGLVSLGMFNPEFYSAGDVYAQKASEIHLSAPQDGCVTINMRQRVGADEALVFWPVGEEWISAEPRRATPDEVRAFCQTAIEIGAAALI